jgi:hypothetical protein
MQGASRRTLLDSISGASAVGVEVRVILGVDDFPDAIDDAELDALHAVGVRGVRLFLTAWPIDAHDLGPATIELGATIKKLGTRFARLGWVISIICPPSVWTELADVLRSMDPRVKVLADHFAWVFPGD